MANYFVTDTDLHSVAMAITDKAGLPERPLLFPSGFITAIQNLGGGAFPEYTDISNYVRVVHTQGSDADALEKAFAITDGTNVLLGFWSHTSNDGEIFQIFVDSPYTPYSDTTGIVLYSVDGGITDSYSYYACFEVYISDYTEGLFFTYYQV